VRYGDIRDLHSFPTRRSSDLVTGDAEVAGERAADGDIGNGEVLDGDGFGFEGGGGGCFYHDCFFLAWGFFGDGWRVSRTARPKRSEEHTSELQSRENLVCRLL